MYPTGRYNLNFNISAFLLAAFIAAFCLFKKDMQKKTSRIYFLIVSFLGISALSEVFTLMMRNDPEQFDYTLCCVTSLISHLLHNSVPYLFLMYVYAYFRMSKKKTDPLKFLMLSIPEIVLCILIIVPQLRVLCWDIGRDGTYTHGVLYNYFFAVTLFYILCIIAEIISKRKAFHSEIGYVMLFIAAITVSLIMQAVSSHLKITYFIQMLATLAAYFLLENNGENTDKNTGALNRYAFQQNFVKILGTNTRTNLIVIKTQTQHYSSTVFGLENIGAIQKSIYTWLSERFGKEAEIFFTGRGNFAMLVYKDDGFNTEDMMNAVLQRFRNRWKGSSVDLVIPVQILITDVPDKAVSMNQINDIVFTEFDAKLGDGKISYINGMTEQMRRSAVEMAIQRAIDNSSFEVYYQPIYDKASGRIHSAEALIRMNDKELGFVSPEEFIHIAEENGTINTIGKFVLEEVCRFISEEDVRSLGIDFIEVNLSTVQCMDEALPVTFDAILRKYNVPHEMINLEITETALYYNETEMLQIVTELKNRGFSFSLDDFGTGYSNYSYIIKFPFSLIKIDKSFLWAADESDQSERLLEHMIQMVHDLDLKTVVEGVETDIQRAKLEDRCADYLQGFLFSRPVCGSDFLKYIRRYNK